MGDKRDSWLEEFLSENVVGVLVGVLLVAVVSGVTITRAYFVKYGEVPGDPASWGQLGDYLGGVLNPVFGFLSVFALLVALVLQTRELKLSRESLVLSRDELKLSREEQAKAAEALGLQNKAIRQQSFEQTFFSMLRLLEEVVSQVSHPRLFPPEGGRKALAQHIEDNFQNIRLRNMYPNSPMGAPTYPEEVRASLLLMLRDDSKGQMTRFLRVLVNILEHMHCAGIQPSDIYPRTFKSLLSEGELRFIYFSCFGDEWVSLKKLVEAYGLLQYLNGEKTGAPGDYYSFFDRSAFAG